MISVIVPVFNVEQYLRDCIESILMQSYTDYELILVDDGSPDQCGEICDDYANKDNRIRVIHQNNQGLSGARNSGIDVARGEYLTFIDSDDYVSPQYLSVLLEALRELDADIAICRTLGFIDGEKPKARVESTAQNRPLSGKEACIMLYDGREEVPVNAWGKLFRKDIISNLRFPEGRIHEDQMFTPQVCYRAKTISVIDAELYYYRSRNDSIMQERFTVKRYDDLWAIDQCIALFQSKNEKNIVIAAYRKRKRQQAKYSIYARRDGVDVPKEYRMCLLTALLYLRKSVQPVKYGYFLAQVSPRLARVYEYERRVYQFLKRE